MNQEIQFMECLTVLETIQFYHSLFHPHFDNQQEYINLCNAMNLGNVINNRIGNSIDGGISLGEKKRLLLLCQILRNDPILILDEPFSGLSKRMIIDIFKILKNYVMERDIVCIVSIHNPPQFLVQNSDCIYNIQDYQISRYHYNTFYDDNSFDEIDLSDHSQTSDQEFTSLQLTSPLVVHQELRKFIILLSRELIYYNRNYKNLISKSLLFLGIGLFKLLLLGSLEKKIIRIKSMDDTFLIPFFMHIMINFYSVSMLPILFIYNQFAHISFIQYESDLCWYPKSTMRFINYVLEFLQLLFLGIIYTLITFLPSCEEYMYWIYLGCCLGLLIFTFTVLQSSAVWTKNLISTISVSIFYNTVSYLLNIGFILSIPKNIGKIIQYLSITHTYMNAMLIPICKKNDSVSIFLDALNIHNHFFSNPLEAFAFGGLCSLIVFGSYCCNIFYY
jgi:hypothetical protein